MTALLSLPNELLLNVVNDLLPDDLENFSQTCKIIHALSTNALRAHAANKKKYSKLTLSLRSRPDYHKHPLFLIRDILMDPRIAYYPVELLLTGSQIDDHTPKENLEHEFASTLTVFEAKLFSMIHNHADVDSEEAARWRADLRWNSLSSFLALLLTMLPNVQRMIIHDCSSLRARLIKITDMIWRVRCTPSSDLPARLALSKLSEVSFTNPRGRLTHGSYPWLDLLLWERFAVLPCMRSLHGEQFRGHPPANEGEEPPKDESVDQLVPLTCKPSIREIRLESSAVAGPVFESMLTGVTALQRFTYSHAGDGEWRGAVGPFRPKTMMEILQSNAISTLVYLDLTWQYPHEFSHLPDAHFIGSLRAFTALKHIRVRSDLLLRPNSSVHEPLVDVLPASAEQLDLVGWVGSEIVTKLLVGLPERKEERVPSLECITFQKRVPVSWEIRRVYEKGGIYFSLS